LLFKEDDRFAQQSEMVIRALEKLPAYHLAYGSDPATIVPLLQKVLMDGDLSGDNEQPKLADMPTDLPEFPMPSRPGSRS
jgi:hypothetical protein